MGRRIDTVKILVDADTGEELSSIVVTAKQKDGYQQKLKAIADFQARGYAIRKQCDELGGFTWLIYNTGEALSLGLKPDNLAKVIFLSTYMDYDNYLTTGDSNRWKKRMTKSEVYTLLKVKERKFWDFWGEVKTAGVLIEEPDTGYIKLNEEVFHKGSLEKVDVSKSTIRIYAKAVRDLYKKATVREHKLLSYVFQAIPYINIRYNILCDNPEASELQSVRRLCLADYCRLVGYDPSHSTQLKGCLKRLTVMGEGVFGFTETCVGDSIFVNPRIYYGGHNYEEVRVLGKFFREKE